MPDQHRLCMSKSGVARWIKLTDDDRIRVINMLPGRWPEMVKLREGGMPLDDIWKRQTKLSFEDFRQAMAECYVLVEYGLIQFCEYKAGWRNKVTLTDPRPQKEVVS
jgi:hypothetical protein